MPAAEVRLQSADLGGADLGNTLADLCAGRNMIVEYPAAVCVDLGGLEHLDSNRQSDFVDSAPPAVEIVVVRPRALNPPVWGTLSNFGPKREGN